MLKGQLHLFNVYINPEAEENLADAVYVRESFNLWAFLFTLFWALYHRMWLVAGGLFVIQMVMFMLSRYGVLSEQDATIIGLFVQAWLGWHASDLRDYTLKKRGYILSDVVSGENDARAQLRFLDRVLGDGAKQSEVAS